RTNLGGAFNMLSPRQQLTPTPFAIQSLNAFSASSLPVGVSVTGTFIGNGSGLTNIPGVLPQQFASGTNILVQANRVYNLTNSGQTVLSTPTNANVGDVIQINGLGSGNWTAYIGNLLDPAGQNWTPRGPNSNWVSVAMSADGTKMFAALYNDQIYR